VISKRYALIVPALNEAETIADLLRQIPRDLFAQIIVVDNGSVDGTASLARENGAEVVSEPRRGYGRACLAGLEALHPATSAVVFMDADLSDDPMDLTRLVRRFETGGLDLAIGSRMLGNSEPGALTPLQRFGNWLTTRLIRWIWNVSFTDLGPLRIVGCEALGRLDLHDPDFGWNVEMQAKAASLRLRIAEVPVQYRKRRFGKSKISGTIVGSLRAGIKILWMVYCCWRSGARKAPVSLSS
jgi:glycosyltransferase involved in cell wall biosynthesis